MSEFSWHVKNAPFPVETTIFFLLACFLPKTVAVRSPSGAPSIRSRSIDAKIVLAPDASRTRIDRSRPSTAPSHESNCGLRTRTAHRSGSNLNVVSGLNSRSDVSVGMNPSAGPRTRLERAGPRSGPAPSQTRRSGCRVPWHTPSVSTRGVGSARTTRRCGFSPPATLREASSKNDALTSPGRRFHDPTQPSAPPFSLTYGEPLAPISNRSFRCSVRAETRRRYTAWSTSRARGKRKAPRKPPWGKDPFT